MTNNSISDMFDNEWSVSRITDELLEKHEIIPFEIMPNGFINYVMNFIEPEGIDFWEIGKQLQAEGFDIPFRCEYEVAAGYWQWLRERRIKRVKFREPDAVCMFGCLFQGERLTGDCRFPESPSCCLNLRAKGEKDES